MTAMMVVLQKEQRFFVGGGLAAHCIAKGDYEQAI
jgi:hypothetical protein